MRLQPLHLPFPTAPQSTPGPLRNPLGPGNHRLGRRPGKLPRRARSLVPPGLRPCSGLRLTPLSQQLSDRAPSRGHALPKAQPGRVLACCSPAVAEGHLGSPSRCEVRVGRGLLPGWSPDGSLLPLGHEVRLLLLIVVLLRLPAPQQQLQVRVGARPLRGLRATVPSGV